MNQGQGQSRGRGRGQSRGRGRGQSRGRNEGMNYSSHIGRSSSSHCIWVRVGRSPSDRPFDSNDESSVQTPGNKSMNIRKQFDRESNSDHPYQQDFPLPGIENISSNTGKLKMVQNLPEAIDHSPKQISHKKTVGTESSENSECLPQEVPYDIYSVRVGQPPSDGPFDSNDGSSVQTPGNISMDIRKQFDCESTSDHPYQQGFPLPDIENISSNVGKLKMVQNLPEAIDHSPKQISHEKTAGTESSENSECLPQEVPYDICPATTEQLVVLKAPLHLKNRERRNQVKHSMEGLKIIELRPGMVILKGYIDCSKQVEIVKLCRKLGLGSGGFYQPGYRDGAKLNLKMMCLGKSWDPETSKYKNERPTDGAKPPDIPNEFCDLVKHAIQDSHAFLKAEKKVHNVVDVLPSMQPDICIVNFYTKSGRLGLHKDKDESPESLSKGLPVVSFSIGGSAEFLYGDQKENDKAEKVVLESGDVLIFGGKSRHVFHGVSSINPDTAPKDLVEATNIRPGRLNLTFRKY